MHEDVYIDDVGDEIYTDYQYLEDAYASCIEVLSFMERENIQEMIERFKAGRVSFYYWDEFKFCGCYVGTYAYLEGGRQNDAQLIDRFLIIDAPFAHNPDECAINGFFCSYVKDAETEQQLDNLNMVIGWMEKYLES